MTNDQTFIEVLDTNGNIPVFIKVGAIATIRVESNGYLTFVMVNGLSVETNMTRRDWLALVDKGP